MVKGVVPGERRWLQKRDIRGSEFQYSRGRFDRPVSASDTFPSLGMYPRPSRPCQTPRVSVRTKRLRCSQASASAMGIPTASATPGPRGDLARASAARISIASRLRTHGFLAYAAHPAAALRCNASVSACLAQIGFSLPDWTLHNMTSCRTGDKGTQTRRRLPCCAAWRKLLHAQDGPSSRVCHEGSTVTPSLCR